METAEEAAKARRKEIHRKSMILTGALIAGSALAAAWVRFAPLPTLRLGGQGQPADKPILSPMRVRWSGFAQGLEAARRSDKLVLLSLAAPWSSASRLMDGTAYADARVAAALGRDVVAVRVDADEEPDLALRYLGAGWPTTALLLPTGEVLDSGTFMSADVLLRWVETITKRFRERRDGVERAARAAGRRREEQRPVPAGDAAQALEKARRALEETWIGPVVFPRFDRLLALRRLRAAWAPALARRGLAAALTLEDRPRGGFHRDSGRGGRLDAEKRLGDQAEALEYLSGADPHAALRLRLYIQRAFVDAEGGYFGEAGDRRLFCDENGRMAAAMLHDSQASKADRAQALKTVERWAAVSGPPRRRLGGPGSLLLGDQLGFLEALLAAGKVDRALTQAFSTETALLDERGEAFYDRPKTGELPEGLDRIRFAGLNARARRDWLALARAAGQGAAQRQRLNARVEALGRWLWAHPEGLDAGDLAELAEERLGGFK